MKLSPEELMDTIYNQIWSDDAPYDNKGRETMKLWDKSTPDQRKAINEFCMCLCGWQFETLLTKDYLQTRRIGQ